MPASAILYAHQNDDAVSSILAIGQHPQQPIQSSMFDCHISAIRAVSWENI